MSSATVHLGNGTSIALDAIQGDQVRRITRGILLTLEGRVPGEVLNCAMIPADKVRAVIASLELVAGQVQP